MEEEKTWRDAKNEYQRKWHKDHPEKNREYMIRYYTKKAQQAQQAGAANNGQ